jgi:hypothetical protein
MSALAPLSAIVAIWKVLQHARALANGQADAWAMLDGTGEDVFGLGEIVARIEQARDLRAVARPLLDLVEHAVIRIERVARFLIRPAAHGHASRTVGVARPCRLVPTGGSAHPRKRAYGAAAV